MLTPVSIAGYILLFFGLGVVFLAVNLKIGEFLRPSLPSREKQEIYECGEPAIGSSFVQFDLRFYVVALLFIIFDVEVAFFFPWATVFGKASNLANPQLPVVMQSGDTLSLTPAAQGILTELGANRFSLTPPLGGNLAAATAQIKQSASQLSFLSLCDILVFFAVLMVGFAYVWRLGDLDWVRAVSQARKEAATELSLGSRGSARSILDREPAISP
ncbi:MAG: NADH-quinone oxidoreductase subunit A [Pirellulales bacterium]|nr:NADH-quinone oxidoreductase subunit A [Pirellulales bacterium]